MATRPRRRGGAGSRLLLLLLLLAVLAVVLFFALGGSFDFNADADLNAPDVNLDPGELPQVEVTPAAPAEAGTGD